MKTYVVGAHWKRLIETLPMSTDSMFSWRNKKDINNFLSKKNSKFSRAVQVIVCWVLVGLWVKMGFGLKDFHLKSEP